MVSSTVMNLLLTLSILLFALLFQTLLNAAVERLVREKAYHESRAKMVKKSLKWLVVFVSLLLLLWVWGASIGNVWVGITSVLALIAIGFIAVWSILSNILAGVLLFFTGAIRVGDEIMIVPEKVRGKVISLNLMFCVLQAKDKSRFSVPNNLLFQRIIRTYPRSSKAIKSA